MVADRATKLATVGAIFPRVAYPRNPLTSTDTVPPRFRFRQSTSSAIPPGWGMPFTKNGALLKKTVVNTPAAGPNRGVVPGVPDQGVRSGGADPPAKVGRVAPFGRPAGHRLGRPRPEA